MNERVNSGVVACSISYVWKPIKKIRSKTKYINSYNYYEFNKHISNYIMYIRIYICMCVCVCVLAYLFRFAPSDVSFYQILMWRLIHLTLNIRVFNGPPKSSHAWKSWGKVSKVFFVLPNVRLLNWRRQSEYAHNIDKLVQIPLYKHIDIDI